MERMCRQWLNTVFMLLVLLLTACMPKVEEEETVPVVKINGATVDGNAAQASIIITGSCPTDTYSLRVMVDESEFNVGSTSSSSFVAHSGVPVATCSSSGALTVTYPVPNPTQARTLTFKVKARLNDGRSSLEWAIKSIEYTPAPAGFSGFLLSSVGGVGASSDVSMYAAGGELSGAPSGSTQVYTATDYSLRAGMYGNVLE